MFREVPRQLDFPASERETLKFWDDQQIYQKSLDKRRGGRPFVFYEGPPTANGLPHPGHCLTRAMKDLFPRYKTMCGYYCERKAGWDTHGLPVEVEVCKELGIHSKEDIEKFGIEPFIHKCMESVFRYTKEWETLTRRLGFWVNLHEAYVTYHKSYVESVWWALKTLFDAGQLYQGHKIVWWWAQGGTALSSGEVGQGYREVDDPSVFVRFPVVEDERFEKVIGKASDSESRTSLLVWTTTPWTLPSNMFAAVNEGFDYAIVRDSESGERLIFAAALVEVIAKKAKKQEAWTVEKTVKGSDLVGLRYEPPFDGYYNRPSRELTTLGDVTPLGALTLDRHDGHVSHVCWRVLHADFVTLESGTGLVHEAPAFGEVDFNLLQEERSRFMQAEGIPLLNAVASNGTFTDEGPEYCRGRWVKECDKEIIRDLKDRGLLLHHELYRHDYPFCWRADEDALIQYPRKSWFVRTTQFKDEMLANNAKINWLPEHIKEGRFGKFLESNVDWALSRERYWGTPLPIWVCDASGKMEAIGSYAELMEKADVQGTEVWDAAKKANPDLSEHLMVHKPYIDSVHYQSPFDANARMRRVTEVIDCWFDSGAMPFAQWGFPHLPKSVEQFPQLLPADFISEALDQTRGWFYSLTAISTLLFGRSGVARPNALPSGADVTQNYPQPFRNCIVLGLLLGEDGLKMSKSKRNYKSPDHIFDHEGADAMRWLFFSGQAPWTSIRFQESAIAEGQREFLIRLYNVYSFFVIYANIDGWKPGSGLCGQAVPPRPPRGATELDRWMLSELHRTVRDVRQSMDAYDNFIAAKRLSDLVDGLSNWYVRRSRDRYWKSGMDDDKNAAYSVLYECLVTISLLSAPFVPFFSENMYRNLIGSRGDASLPESVHLCDYPVVCDSLIEESLSGDMAIVRDIVSLGRAARAESRVKVRQPLSLVEIVLADPTHTTWLSGHTRLICDELNVKKVEFTIDADHYVDYQVKPNFKAIGPKFGKLAPAIKAALAAVADPAAMRRDIAESGAAKLTVNGETVLLSAEDVQVEISAKPGWAAAHDRNAVVVLKTEITDELRREGLAREITHAVQQMRKDLDLQYTQRITLSMEGDAELTAIAQSHQAFIAGETLTDSIAIGSAGGDAREFEIEGHKLRIAVATV